MSYEGFLFSQDRITPNKPTDFPDYEDLIKSWNRNCMIWGVNGQYGFTEYSESKNEEDSDILRSFDISSSVAMKLIEELELKSSPCFKIGKIWYNNNFRKIENGKT